MRNEPFNLSIAFEWHSNGIEDEDGRAASAAFQSYRGYGGLKGRQATFSHTIANGRSNR